MKYAKLSFLAAMLMMVAMSSCTNDNELNSTKSEYVNSVRVTVEDFVPESSSRTAYTVDDTGFHFQWIDGDALGIYPVGGDQVKFPISSGDGSASAMFDGGAWKLRSEYQYAAYYPFSAGNYTISEEAIPVTFTGQTQDGNGSTAHLGKYDYLACGATTPDANGSVDLTMKHLGAFLRLQLTMPKADTYSKVVLESNGTPFVTAGTFDLTAATPAITATETSNTYTINLTNVSTTEKNQVVTVYAIVAPANLSTSNMKITVYGEVQPTYVQTVIGKDFVARSAYNIIVASFPDPTTGIENGHEWVEIGGLKWATMNVGATTVAGNPATCYGDYFAWGETEPRYTGIIISGANSVTFSGWKSDHSYGYSTKDYPSFSARTLDAKHDAATQIWGSKWRTPTKNDFGNLIEACTGSRSSSYSSTLSTSSPSGGVYWLSSSQTYLPEYNGVAGMLFVDKTDISKRVFFPGVGRVDDGTDYYGGGTSGRYWSSNDAIYSSGSNYAEYMSISSSRCGIGFTAYRCVGHAIRPVSE